MKKQHETIQVIGLGQACIDYLGDLTSYPQEDDKIELNNLHIRCGGPASTALVSLSRLGISTSFLGSISDDPFGMEILKNLKKEKVDVSFLKITPGYMSQFAFISVTKKSAKRTIFWYRGTVPYLRPRDVDLSRFPNARILHIDGLMVDACMEAARQAKTSGMTVVMDAGTMREGSKELASLVDILISSEIFAKPLVGPEAAHETSLQELRKLGPKQVVITFGSEGSIGLNDKGISRQAAFPVNAVDTTGAGDVYHGGYIYGLLQGWEMSKCMRFASAAAALKCVKTGAQTGIPDLKAINNFISLS
ncbi:MAG: sugar kinase [Desulfobacteraceae bacterium]|nr:sugar kinase [Desulfobacteraceae bacterium]